jgi:hypothetical protein
MKYGMLIFALWSSLCLSAQRLLSPVEEDALHRIELFLRGVTVPQLSAQQQANYIRFIYEDLEMDVLAASDYWNHVISATFILFPEQKDFADAMIANLQRTRSPHVFLRLANDLVTICEQYAWFEAEDRIVSCLQASGRIPHPHGKLLKAFEQHKLTAGSEALPIAGVEDLRNSLLVFYDSGCDHCQAEIEALKQHYATLQAQGIRVISIAADLDVVGFTNYATTFPWTDRLCDFEGLEGENFVKYGINGTPTLYRIDAEGKIVGRYALLKEIIK